MLIRTRLGVSVDGFIASSDGRPAFLAMADFSPDGSYDWPDFEQQIYVLTSQPLPAGIPADVVVADHSPAGLLGRLREANLQRDAFLLGGQRTLQAFLELCAIDQLQLLVLPVILGEGIPFSPPGSAARSLHLEEHRAFPDGTLRTVYSLFPKSRHEETAWA